MDNCIFCKIAKKEIPKEFTYEDDEVMVFPDIHPVRPVHLLIVPKKHITELLTVADPALFQNLFTVAQQLIQEQGLENKGYRMTINGGGAQLVQHLHVHLTGPLKNDAAI
jgi:histidine triad (HIT) family protein